MSSTLWLIGHEARVPAGALIAPSHEIAAIVTLSPELLRRTAREAITYDQIMNAGDGSFITVRPGVTFD
jgi:hypothetical protein